ncbi:MAG TPA: hypothetical protein VHV80_03210 [Steroidobacteraceae bacterium]|jgi:hypothetical protein|nr:hypothetical protein [Steroidobacteraceae bacterium]
MAHRSSAQHHARALAEQRRELRRSYCKPPSQLCRQSPYFLQEWGYPSWNLASHSPIDAGVPIKKGMIDSPSHGDTAFTVPLFAEFMKRTMPG